MDPTLEAMKPYLITAIILIAALAVPVTIGQRKKAREAEARELVSQVQAAAFRAAELKLAVDKGSASAGPEYTLALAELQRIKDSALEAGAESDEVESKAANGRMESAFAESDRQGAKRRSELAKIRAEAEASVQGAAARLAEIQEVIQRKQAEQAERAAETAKRKSEVEKILREIEHGPEAKPSSVPGLPPGVEPSKRAEPPPGVTRGK